MSDILPDNPAFFISGIRPDTEYGKPDIRPDIRLSKKPDIRQKMELRKEDEKRLKVPLFVG